MIETLSIYHFGQNYKSSSHCITFKISVGVSSLQRVLDNGSGISLHRYNT